MDIHCHRRLTNGIAPATTAARHFHSLREIRWCHRRTYYLLLCGSKQFFFFPPAQSYYEYIIIVTSPFTHTHTHINQRYSSIYKRQGGKSSLIYILGLTSLFFLEGNSYGKGPQISHLIRFA